jgi:hypothetical protein
MIIKNLLSLEESEYVKNIIMCPSLPWYWKDSVVTDILNFNHYFGFTHQIIVEDEEISDIYSNIKFMINRFSQKTNIRIKKIVRIQANLSTLMNITDEQKKKAIHKDYLEDNYVSFVYYVHDSDGETLVFDDDKINIVEKCTPKQGDALWFKSNSWHMATPPKQNKRRVIINFVLEIYPEI